MKNIKIMIKIFLCFLFFVSFFNFTFAEKVSEINPSKYVNDYADIIGDNEQSVLEKDLYDFYASTTHQIVIVTVNKMESETAGESVIGGGETRSDYIEHYSIKLAEKIKAGSAKNDNGILVLVSKNDRQMRVEVGYGLEEVVTDGKSSYIINQIMAPNFKNGDYTKGIVDGASEILKIVSDKSYSPEKSENTFFKNVPVDVIFFSIILLLTFGSVFLQWVVSVLGRTKSWWLGGVLGLIISVIIFFFIIKIIWVFIMVMIGFLFDYFVSKNYKEHKEGIQEGPADWWSGGSWGPGSSGGWGGGYNSSDGGFSGGGGSFGGGGSSGSW